jgi:hypothetical protein
MADKKHAVTMKTSSLELTKADVKFDVSRGGEKFGTLFLSRGAVVWRPKDGKKNYKVGWTKFDTVMRTGTKTHGR